MNPQRSNERNSLEYKQYASPTSTLSSGFGTSGTLYEDNLPEVRPDNSPQALSKLDAEYKRQHFEEREPKYPVIYDDAPKTAVPPGDLEHHEPRPHHVSEITGGEAASAAKDSDPPAKKNKICGLTVRTFFIVLAIMLLIIAAAVGGGVGGTLSSRKSKNAAPASEADSNSTSSSVSNNPTPTTSQTSSMSSTTSSSTSATSTIESLNNQTSPTSQFSFQGWSGFNYTGRRTSIIHDERGTDFGFSLNSYVWLPNKLDCCMSFCHNATSESVGWLCDERYQNRSSASFERIYVWCGKDRVDASAVCS